MEATKSSILEAAERLAAILKSVPADERQQKALYHLQRLQLAVSASHSEAVRFAAFTVDKTVRDAGSAWGQAAAAMAQLRAELEANGHEF